MRTTHPAKNNHNGFALVASLSLMILLTLVAVGLLSLSAISLRGTTQAQARAEAQANARLALMLALGELQKQVGPDQRITANGAILSNTSVSHPHWTGSWNSWQAGPPDSINQTPDQPSDHRTIPDNPTIRSGMNPTYVTHRADHFRAWLLSLDPAEAKDVNSARSLVLNGTSMPSPSDTAVRLVGNGSLGVGAKSSDYVSARLLKIAAPTAATPPRGRFGWWVGDESQKARLMNDSFGTINDDTLADRLSRQQSPGSMGTRTIAGLAGITNEPQLSRLPSLATLDIVDGVNGRPSENFHHITPFSRQVIADVREGGLKRDLSTLLERAINLSESSDDFMLYRFDANGQERVPIQDLAAYHQLYDGSRTGWREGIRYTSNLLPKGLQVVQPNYGDKNSQDQYLREYTNLYRTPVPIKVQMMLAARAEPAPLPPNSPPNTPPSYLLRLGLLPAVTLWNPNNVPLVMNLGDPSVFAQQMRLMYLPFMIRWQKGNYTSQPVSIAYAAMGGNANTGQPGWASGGQHIKATIFDMYFSATRPVRFEPGETRVFSYPYVAGDFNFQKHQRDEFQPMQEAQGEDWDIEAFLQMRRSAWKPPSPPDPNVDANGLLVFNSADSLSFTITTEAQENVDYLQYQEAPGAGFNLIMIKKLFQSRAPTGALWNFKNYQFLSRTGGGTSTRDFNDLMIRKGFPSGSGPVQGVLAVGQMIARPNQWFPFLQFALMADCEVGSSIAGPFAGRKTASRPFLHSSPMSPPFIDKLDDSSLYNYGWNWWIEPISSGLEANIGVSAENRGYYGGGYTDGYGTTHVIQQEIPVAPPISIAALSHAQLGGFSLANASPPSSQDNLVTTAIGFGGLFPRTLQAIGNSYAHPLIPADKAYTPWTRNFNETNGPKNLTLADHSYLANKSLWDDFFYSSITSQPTSVQSFGGNGRTARQVAEDFFFKNQPLPNRRIIPYKSDLDQEKLDRLFAQQAVFGNGFQNQTGMADRIAAHLMVEGPFNVNSTSVDAWKALLASLKGKPVAYLDKTMALAGVIDPGSVSTNGTPVGPSTLPNGKPYSSDSTRIENSATPEPWYAWRELNDGEIQQLAEAIVKQIKLRGPFLSLSEFINRRLDATNEELSVKGALQAALDDPAVSINAGFRNNSRQLGAEAAKLRSEAAFPKAVDGPVAYGSAAYVDQADILRSLAEVLTPRGDTFVIRCYGDSVDRSGRIVARAWCEAVVQRTPVYSNPVDEPHLKQSELRSGSNKMFGRRFDVVTFRWLSSDEV